MNILALGATSEDIGLFCAGTLLKYHQQGHSIYIALTTSGNIGSNQIASRDELAAVRKNEQLESAKYYDAQVRFLGFHEGGLHDTPDTRRAVLTAIRWANPDVILTPAPWNPHADQGITGRLVTQVLLSSGGKLHPADLPPIEKTPQVFFWDIPGGIGFLPEVFVDISAEMETKQKVLSTHKSLGEDIQDQAQALSHYRGLQASTDCKYAEAFVSHKMYAFMSDPRMLP